MRITEQKNGLCDEVGLLPENCASQCLVVWRNKTQQLPSYIFFFSGTEFLTELMKTASRRDLQYSGVNKRPPEETNL